MCDTGWRSCHPTLAMYTAKWSYLLSLPSFFFSSSLSPSPQVHLHYVFAKFLSLSHLNRSTWHRLRHSVAFLRRVEHLTLFLYFFFFLLFFLFEIVVSSHVEVARKKRYRPWAAQRFSQSNNCEIVQRVCSVSRCVFLCVCKIKIKRKWEIKKKKRNRPVHSPLEQHTRGGKESGRSTRGD